MPFKVCCSSRPDSRPGLGMIHLKLKVWVAFHFGLSVLMSVDERQQPGRRLFPKSGEAG
jgi:hypothetical protein